jgi:hypothetical protein
MFLLAGDRIFGSRDYELMMISRIISQGRKQIQPLIDNTCSAKRYNLQAKQLNANVQLLHFGCH